MLLPRISNLTAKFADLLIEQRLRQVLMYSIWSKWRRKKSPSDCT